MSLENRAISAEIVNAKFQITSILLLYKYFSSKCQIGVVYIVKSSRFNESYVFLKSSNKAFMGP